MVHGLLIAAVSIMFAYAMFADEIEYEDPKPSPKRKKVQIKRNGEWEDIEK